MDRGFSWLRSFFTLLSGLFLIFVIAPLLNLLLAVSPGQLWQTANDPIVSRSIGITLSMAGVATLIFSLLAIPFAWLFVRSELPFKQLISAFVDLPMVIPHSAAGIALLGIVNRESYVGRIASGIGIDFVDQPAGIAVAMAFVSVPYLFNAAVAAFQSVPLKVEQAAQNLGASPWRVFYSVSVPLAWKGILNGLVMMFARGMSEFGAVVIIAYNPMTTPVLIFDRFNSFGLKSAQNVAALFIFISLLVFIGLRLLNKKEENVRN